MSETETCFEKERPVLLVPERIKVSELSVSETGFAVIERESVFSSSEVSVMEKESVSR